MNPLLGVIYHWLGGLASGSFYVPFRGVKRWSWETSWIVAGVFSWLIAPWFFALLNTSDPVTVLKETPGDVWFYTCLFGALWGLGGLTFGLTMRYLGMSLGMAVALGYCTVFGTLIPPIFKGEFAAKLIEPVHGRWVLAGLVICVIGIVVNALAGRAKESEMSAEQKRETVKEFDFKKGILVATFSGIMSACFAFGLSAGDSVRETTFKVDIVNSALKQGKSAAKTTEPTAAEANALLAAPAFATLFDPKTKASLSALVGILEEPKSIQGKIAALKAAEKPVPDAAGQIERLEKALPAAAAKAGEALTAVSASSGLGTRLSTYATGFNAISDNKVLGIVDGLASLSEKETALSVSSSGADLVAIHEKHHLWTGLPVLIIVLLGGFATNFIWCVLLNLKNKTGYQYLSAKPGAKSPVANTLVEAGSGPSFDGRKDPTPVPLLRNYIFSAIAGVTWYFQFFFYSMGETQMGEYKFSSWTLHMASIIIFSSIWGLALGEWKGASGKSKGLLFTGLSLLILSTLVICYANYLTGLSGGH